MKAIVTFVLRDIPKFQPKRIGVDILGRLSSDADSRHKSVLIENIESIDEVEKKTMCILGSKEIDGRISRIEILEQLEIDHLPKQKKYNKNENNDEDRSLAGWWDIILDKKEE